MHLHNTSFLLVAAKKSFCSWSHWWKNYYCYFLNFLWISKFWKYTSLWFTAEFPGDWVWVWSVMSAGKIILAWGDAERGKVMPDRCVAANWEFLLIWNYSHASRLNYRDFKVRNFRWTWVDQNKGLKSKAMGCPCWRHRYFHMTVN